jgi:hypothetical protein
MSKTYVERLEDLADNLLEYGKENTCNAQYANKEKMDCEKIAVQMKKVVTKQLMANFSTLISNFKKTKIEEQKKELLISLNNPENLNNLKAIDPKTTINVQDLNDNNCLQVDEQLELLLKDKDKIEVCIRLLVLIINNDYNLNDIAKKEVSTLYKKILLDNGEEPIYYSKIQYGGFEPVSLIVGSLLLFITVSFFVKAYKLYKKGDLEFNFGKQKVQQVKLPEGTIPEAIQQETNRPLKQSNLSFQEQLALQKTDKVYKQENSPPKKTSVLSGISNFFGKFLNKK